MYEFLNALSVGIVNASVISIATVGFSLQFGITNYINIAYGDFLTFGAFFWYAFAVGLRVELWVSAVLAVFATGLMAVAVSRGVFTPILRRRATKPFILMIASFGMAVMLENILLAIYGSGFVTIPARGNANVISLGGFQLSGNQLSVVVIVVVVMFGIRYLLTRSKLGKAMRAMSDDDQLAQNCSINTRLITDWTWLITGMIAGIAGCVLALQTVNINDTSGSSELWLIIPASFAGGIGNPYGAVAGATTLGFGIALTDTYLGGQYDIIVGGLLLGAVILLRPQGLFASARRALV